ncbi:MAG: hypothetical protein GEU99_13920 [Luteitalea sp.]|nr:hypothetical protein [Luteitalea sp.]
MHRTGAGARMAASADSPPWVHLPGELAHADIQALLVRCEAPVAITELVYLSQRVAWKAQQNLGRPTITPALPSVLSCTL